MKWCFVMFFDILELWEPSWNDSGSIWDHSFFHHFHHYFHDFLVDRRGSRSLALSVFNDSFKYHNYEHKEKISEAHVFFEWIAPPKSPTYMSKIIKKYALAHGSICLD